MRATLFRTFIVRGVASFGSLALIVCLGRFFGAEGVGVFALAQSLVIGASIFARFGMNNSLMRVVGNNDQSPEILKYLMWAFKLSAQVAMVFIVLLLLLRSWLESVFDAPGLGEMLIGFSLSLPAFVFSFVLSGFFNGIRKPEISSLLQNGAIALLVTIHLIAFEALGVGRLELVGVAFAVSSWIVFLSALSYLFLWLRRQSWYGMAGVVSADFSKKEFYSISNSFFVMSVANLMQSTVSIMIAGWFLTSHDLGLYKSSQQMAVIIAFVLIVVNAVFPPYFARLYKEGDLLKLQSFVKKSTLWAAALALPVTIAAVGFPEIVMSVLGEGFEGASQLFRVIAVAQFVNVVTGPVGFLLGMTGYDKTVRNISLASNFCALLLFLTMIPMLGVTGAAWSLALVLVIQNMLCVYYVWVKLGVWSLPVPNVLKLLGVKVEGGGNNGLS